MDLRRRAFLSFAVGASAAWLLRRVLRSLRGGFDGLDSVVSWSARLIAGRVIIKDVVAACTGFAYPCKVPLVGLHDQHEPFPISLTPDDEVPVGHNLPPLMDVL